MRPIPALCAVVGLALATSTAAAQPPACALPDSIAVIGNSRISRATVIADAGLLPGDTVDFFARQQAQRNLMLSGYVDSLVVECRIVGPSRRAILALSIKERPILRSVTVEGAQRVNERLVRDKLLLIPGRTADPAEITRARAAVDSLYRSRSFYLARVDVDSANVDGGIAVTFRINEGRRLAISGISIEGNSRLSDDEIVGAMATKPEGFLFTNTGEFDDETYSADLAVSIPELYANRGFIDMRVVRDTLIIDPEIGKAMIIVEVEEGPQYSVGSFHVIGNRYFTTDAIDALFPFRPRSPSVTDRLRSIFSGPGDAHDVFSKASWDEASQNLWNMYQNSGFRDADIRPTLERGRSSDSSHVVNLTWQVREGEQAIINRINIVGNSYTVESCIRQRLSFFPGSVYSQDRIIQSMQAIQSMGFFEDLQIPTLEPVNDSLGLLDITFSLTEKKTGSINFGASMGGAGGGLGGFVGFEQPNLFGRCKQGALNWQFGSLVNEFTLTYTDPAVRKSNFSASSSVYHLRSRFTVADFGQQTRTGGSLRIGFPLFNAYATRGFLSYGGERVKYTRDENSLLGTLAVDCDNCFRSTAGVNVSRDTRLGLPFPTSGVYQTVDAQFNGGPLGGTADFQRYTAEIRSYVPVGELGGDPLQGKQPIRLTVGFTLRTGMVFGNTGPFFPNQEFAMGGVQQGEPLRGYEEFTITPFGYVVDGSSLQATRQSFGRAYMSTTAEFGARLSQGVYTNFFFDAGNVWNDPRDFNPSRMFRGAGLGVSLITPLGPLGLDYAYGFDKLDRFGNPAPGWKMHFKLGQIF